MNWIKSQPIAHRGLHTNDSIVPENSLIAFQKAVEKGYAIELDIQLSIDGTIVVFHDKSLERMCGDKALIQDKTLQEIKRYSLAGSNELVPTLEEVLNLVNGNVPILIEIKDGKNNINIQNTLIRVMTSYNGLFAVQSFNPFLLKVLAKEKPDIPRGQLSSDFAGESINAIFKYMLKNYLLNFISKPNFIAHDKKNILRNNKVSSLKRAGLTVLCWTVRDNEEYNDIVDYCDNIIFEGFLP